MKRLIKSILNFFGKVRAGSLLKSKKVRFTKTPSIHGKIYIKNKGSISIGENVVINSSVKSNYTSGTITCLAVAKDAELKIGNNTGISNARIVASERIEIKDNVLIGAGCCVYDTDFHPIGYSDRITNNKKKNGHAPVIIEDGAFIGANSIILKGVTIGKHSVIGAGSVVTKSVPAGQIWAGNPAKYIKDVIEDEGLSN